MSIKPFQADLTPIGHFDFLDSELAEVKGGEVVVFDELPVGTSDKRSPDIFDQSERTLMRLANSLDTGPFFLAQVEDQKSFVSPGFELTSLYATNKQFGQTHDASGKVGLFAQEGFYSVNSEVVDSTTVNAATAVGSRLYASPIGQLTATPSASGAIVGFFVEFRDGDTLRSFNNPLYLPGTHTEGDTIIAYKTNADGYINLDFMSTVIGEFGDLGTPTDGYFTDGYYSFESNTSIVDAVDDLNEGVKTLFDINALVLVNVQSITTDYTLGSSDSVIFADASGGAITVTLGAGIAGRRVVVKKTDSTGFGISVVSTVPSLIEGEPDLLINTEGSSFTIVYDGADWWIV
jgi:hypothetical protein